MRNAILPFSKYLSVCTLLRCWKRSTSPQETDCSWSPCQPCSVAKFCPASLSAAYRAGCAYPNGAVTMARVEEGQRRGTAGKRVGVATGAVQLARALLSRWSCADVRRRSMDGDKGGISTWSPTSPARRAAGLARR